MIIFTHLTLTRPTGVSVHALTGALWEWAVQCTWLTVSRIAAQRKISFRKENEVLRRRQVKETVNRISPHCVTRNRRILSESIPKTAGWDSSAELTFRIVQKSGRYEVMGGQSRDKEGEKKANLCERKDTERSRGRKTCRQKARAVTVGSFTGNSAAMVCCKVLHSLKTGSQRFLARQPE